jgi:hypothetical protein
MLPERVAWPALTVAVPRSVPLLKNCTDPVAFEGVTFAVKLIEAPNVAGFGLLVRVVAVLALTTCAKPADVLGL